MNDKKDRSNRIILPNEDGVASLDIRRVKKELAGKSKPCEMCGCMPAAAVSKVVEQLKGMITDLQEGSVSTICVLAIMPQAGGIDAGSAFFTGPIDEMDKLDELFHAGLLERLEGVPPDDEAG
jgi:hypothetical protein